MWIHKAQRFLNVSFVKFVNVVEKNCVSYSKLSVPFRYDGRFSSNVKSSPQWSAWLSGISQRLEWTIRILRFLSVFIVILVSPFDAEYCNVLRILFSTDRWLVVHYSENRFHSRWSLSFTTLGSQSILCVGWQTYGKTMTNTFTQKKKPQYFLKISSSEFV